jgi:hypothetical protein
VKAQIYDVDTDTISNLLSLSSGIADKPLLELLDIGKLQSRSS